MADWRGDNDQGSGKKREAAKPVRPASPPPPSARSGAEPAARQTKDPKSARTDWRGRPIVADAASQTDGRSWTGSDGSPTSADGGKLVRWTTLGILTLATLGGVGWFLWFVFYRPPGLPVHVISIGRYEDPELVESPFGDANRKALRDSNPGNVEVFPDRQLANDNYLANVFAEGLKRQGSQPLSGGGPSGRLVAVYVNSIATVQDAALVLRPQNSQLSSLTATGTGEGGTQSVPLTGLFEKIASSVQSRSTAWVVLDLHQAPETGSVQEIAWSTLVEKAWQALKPELRSRLIVTVACSDGEENWTAPELGNSFFGHYFLQGLSGGFIEAGQLVKVSTLEEFRKVLDREVTAKVAERRYASQHPFWLIPPERTLETSVVSGVLAERPAITALSGLEARLARTMELWQSFADRGSNSWRWDPAGVAIAEARLMQLEGISLFASESVFEQTANDAARWIASISAPVAPGRASLVERELHERFLFPQQKWTHDFASVAAILEAGEKPSFLRTTPPEGTPAAGAGAAAGTAETALPDPADLKLVAADRPLFVWSWLVRQSKATGRPDRLAAFTALALDQALKYSGSNEDWIELQILRLLRDEVEWENPDSGSEREEAVASAVAAFHRIQGLAGQPLPELVWWLEPEITALDSQFLKGFDLLLAGQFADSLRELQVVIGRLNALEPETQTLANAMTARDEALRWLPHLVLHALREYQFASETLRPAIEQRLSQLGRMAGTTESLSARLGQPPVWPVEAALTQLATEVSSGLREQQAGFRAWQTEQTARDRNAKLNSETFRKSLLALELPFATVPERQFLHENLWKFVTTYETGVDLAEKTNQLKPPFRSLSGGMAPFLEALPNSSSRESWQRLLDGSLRTVAASEIPQQLAGENSASSPVGEWRTRLMLADQSLRQKQLAVAGGFSAQRTLPQQAWPWSASSQRWRFDLAQYRLMQATRLTHAAWGDTDIGQVNDPEKFLFWRLASNYRPEEVLVGAAPIDALATTFRDRWRSGLELTTAHVRGLSAQLGRSGEEVNQNLPRHKSTLSAAGVPMLGTGQASVEYQGKLLELGLNAGEVVLKVPMVISEKPDQLAGVSVDLQPWMAGGRKPEAVLKLRGHSRRTPVDWKLAARERVQYQLELQMDKPVTAMVRVRPPQNPPVINVVLLVDCSDSMDIEVARPASENQPNAGGRAKLMELVRDQANRLVTGLERLQIDRQADVNLCLMPFGMTAPPESGVAFEKVATQIYRTKLAALQTDWSESLTASLDELTPQGATPLYDAMREACLFLNDQTGSANLIYVLSDGVNDTRSVSGLSGTARGARENLGDCRISIFHFDYFDQWIDQALKQNLERKLREDEVFKKEFETYYAAKPEELPDYFRDAKANELKLKENGIGELVALGSEGKGIVYNRYEPTDFDALVKDLEASIPRLNVVVTTEKGEVVSIDPGHSEYVINEGLPCDVTVTASGPWFGSATRTVHVAGGEVLELTFDNNGPSLRMPRFRDKHDEFELLDNGASRKPDQPLLYLREIREQTGHWKYQIGFGESDPRNETFVQRPAFVAALLQEADSGRQAGRRIPLSDHFFVPGTHFPVAETSGIQLNTTDHRLRIWYAATLPDCVERIPLEQLTDEAAAREAIAASLQRLQSEDTALQIALEGNRLTCTARPAESGGSFRHGELLVICPTAVAAQHDFDLTQNSEAHTFTLGSGNGSAEPALWLVSVARLDASLDGNLQTYDSNAGKK